MGALRSYLLCGSSGYRLYQIVGYGRPLRSLAPKPKDLRTSTLNTHDRSAADKAKEGSSSDHTVIQGVAQPVQAVTQYKQRKHLDIVSNKSGRDPFMKTAPAGSMKCRIGLNACALPSGAPNLASYGRRPELPILIQPLKSLTK